MVADKISPCLSNWSIRSTFSEKLKARESYSILMSHLLFTEKNLILSGLKWSEAYLWDGLGLQLVSSPLQ